MNQIYLTGFIFLILTLLCLLQTFNGFYSLGLGKLGQIVTGPTESVLLGSVKMTSLGEEGIRKGKELDIDTPWARWLQYAGDRSSALRAGLL